MADNRQATSGYFQPTDGRPVYLRISGDKVSWHEAGREVYDKVEYELGQYGEAKEELVEVSGSSSYNIKLTHLADDLWHEETEDTQEELGIFSEDRER